VRLLIVNDFYPPSSIDGASRQTHLIAQYNGAPA